MTPTRSRDRLVARRVLLAGLALGLLAELALDGSAFGIGVPILVMAVLVAGWVRPTIRAGARPARRVAAGRAPSSWPCWSRSGPTRSWESWMRFSRWR